MRTPTGAAISRRIVQLLREERERKGISMTALAAKAGLSQQSISYVERSMRSPSLDTLLRIAEALDADLGTVITKGLRASQKMR